MTTEERKSHRSTCDRCFYNCKGFCEVAIGPAPDVCPMDKLVEIWSGEDSSYDFPPANFVLNVEEMKDARRK